MLVSVHETGVLITGESGIGKSECGLDLVTRGHKFVADDAVELRVGTNQELVGTVPIQTSEMLEIRGIGLINVRETFGTDAVLSGSTLSLIIELVRWNKETRVDRLGIDVHTQEIFGISVEKFQLPVSPGRNLAVLVETAVRIFNLRKRGQNAALDFAGRHAEMLRKAMS